LLRPELLSALLLVAKCTLDADDDVVTDSGDESPRRPPPADEEADVPTDTCEGRMGCNSEAAP
jgi:hypothetical protein